MISTTILFTAEEVLHDIVAAGTMAGLGTVARTTKEIWEVEAAISICVGVGWAGTRDSVVAINDITDIELEIQCYSDAQDVGIILPEVH